MSPIYRNGNVSTRCPDCAGALTTFEKRSSSGEYGYVIRDEPHTLNGKNYTRYLYVLMRCGGCGRAGLAEIHDNGNVVDGFLKEFFPVSAESAMVPGAVPQGIVNEFREAELCAVHGAYRAASTLLRSTLEKTLRENGYTSGNLESKIDQAFADGIITAPHRNKAHEDIRSLGNEVVHDDYRPITQEENEVAHKYAQRILEDFYDVRSEVEKIVSSRLQKHASECEAERKLVATANEEISKNEQSEIAEYVKKFLQRQLKRLEAELKRLETKGIRPSD